MGGVGYNALRAALLEGVSSVAEGAAGVDHIVDDDALASVNLADDVHDLGDVRTGTALVDDGNVDVIHELRHGAGTHNAAHVRGNDYRVLEGPALEVLDENLAAEQVVDGHVEEALDLLCVEVNGDDTVNADAREEVSDNLRGDGHTCGAYAAVLAGIAEIGDDGGDASCGCAAERVDHDEELHQVVIGGSAGGLDYEHIAAADVLIDLNVNLTIAETIHSRVTQLGLKTGSDLAGELRSCVAGKQSHV